MTQPNSQHIQALAAEPVRASATRGFSASIRSVRSVAMSLLVDRALSA